MLTIASVTNISAAKPSDSCATIQDGALEDSTGNPITLGYDQWGYNYQAHMFNGWLDNYSRPSEPVTGGINLMMKWNDAWLSNMNCSNGNTLDRHFGHDSYINSGAWLTNHASGTYTGTGDNYQWVINTAPVTVDVTYGGHWLYTANFIQAGTVLTGSLTDPYVQPGALTGSIINGSIVDTHVEFSFDYGLASLQGVRTYTGDIDSSGNLVGFWTQTGSQSTGESFPFTVVGFATKTYLTCEWSDFVKIVAIQTGFNPLPDVEACPLEFGLDGAMWYTADDTEVGCSIWGEFALIQDVYNDPCGEANYDQPYHSPFRSGLGNWLVPLP